MKTKTQKARHRYFTEELVTWKVVKDVVGRDMVEFRFKNGEKSGMSPELFHETFEVIL